MEIFHINLNANTEQKIVFSRPVNEILIKNFTTGNVKVSVGMKNFDNGYIKVPAETAELISYNNLKKASSFYSFDEIWITADANSEIEVRATAY